MRYLAIGDIHGNYRALRALADAVHIGSGDRIIAMGDYVDRGLESAAVLDWLIQHHQAGILIAIRGNHEIMMLEARGGPEAAAQWCACGGDATLHSYGTLEDVPPAHWSFLEEDLVPYAEIDSHFFVHANAYPDIDLDDQPEYMLAWESYRDGPPHVSGKVMVCGHTPQPSGHPRNLGHAICLDTGSGRGGWLTCLDIRAGRYWQADETGRVRAAWLA